MAGRWWSARGPRLSGGRSATRTTGGAHSPARFAMGTTHLPRRPFLSACFPSIPGGPWRPWRGRWCIHERGRGVRPRSQALTGGGDRGATEPTGNPRKFRGFFHFIARNIDGATWFVTGDVCRALGLTLRAGATRHLTNLNPIEVRLHPVQANHPGWAGAGRDPRRREAHRF